MSIIVLCATAQSLLVGTETAPRAYINDLALHVERFQRNYIDTLIYLSDFSPKLINFQQPND